MKIKNHLLCIFLINSIMHCNAMDYHTATKGMISSIGNEILSEPVSYAWYSPDNQYTSSMGGFLAQFASEYPYDFLIDIRRNWNHNKKSLNLHGISSRFSKKLTDHFFNQDGTFKYPNQTFQEFITQAEELQKQPQTNVQTPAKETTPPLPTTSSNQIPTINTYIDPFSFGIGVGVGVISMIIVFQLYKKYKNKEVENISTKEPSKKGNSTIKNVSPIEASQ